MTKERMHVGHGCLQRIAKSRCAKVTSKQRAITNHGPPFVQNRLSDFEGGSRTKRTKLKLVHTQSDIKHKNEIVKTTAN